MTAAIMRPLIFLGAALAPALVVASLAGTIAGGCSNKSCEDLAEVCARCTDVSIRTDCEEDVLADVQSICSDREAVYQKDCPFGVDAGSPTGSTVSSASVGTGGAGGVGGTTASSTAATGGMGGAAGGGGTAGAGGN